MDQFVRIYQVKKGFIEVIWSYCKFLWIFVYNFTVFRDTYHNIYFSVLKQFLHIVCTIEGFSYMG